MATETELKLSLSDAGERKLAAHDAFRAPAASDPRRERIVTTYFDTADHALARLGVSLRVRRAGQGRVQTVKATAAAGSPSRGEWEWKIDSDEPDLSLTRDTPLAEGLPEGAQLQATVVTDVMRTTRLLHLRDATIEAAFDEGTIQAGEARERIRELELELREGSQVALYRLALTLHAAAPLALEVDSKAVRGARMEAGDPPAPVKADPPDLPKGSSAAEALRIVVARALGHVLANKTAALAGVPEGIHQARTGLRRLRSALALFAPLLDPRARVAFNEEMRRLGRSIGEARDWDVFCEERLTGAFADLEEPGWGRLLREAAEGEREGAHRRAAAEIAGPAFTSLALGLGAWSEEGARDARLIGRGALKQDIARLAPGLLEALLKKTRRRAAMARDKSATELHPLRKSLKKLRYAVEFLSRLYPEKKIRAYLKRMKKLQDALGDLNDAATASLMARGLARGRVEIGVAAAQFQAKQDKDAAKARRQFERQWKKFEKERPFWL